MDSIKLKKRFQYAWYGQCGTDEQCQPYVFANNLTDLKQSVEMISSFTTGSNNSVDFFKPDTEEGSLKQLNCGAMYSIVLKSGAEISIDHLVPAGSETRNSGGEPAKVSFTCAEVPTPSPTPFICIPETLTPISVDSITTVVQIRGFPQQFINFQSGDNLGIDLENLEDFVGIPFNVTVNIPGQTTAFIGLNSVTPTSDSNKNLYLSRGDACYAGSFEKDDDTWFVNMELISGEASTPTPKTTPTPTKTPQEVEEDPTPTPTPTPKAQSPCCPDAHTQINANGQPTGDNLQDMVTIEHNLGDKTTVLAEFLSTNDQIGAILCTDLSFDQSQPPNENTSNVQSLIKFESASNNPVGSFRKILNNGSDTIFYIDVNGVCWTGTYVSGQDIILNLS